MNEIGTGYLNTFSKLRWLCIIFFFIVIVSAGFLNQGQLKDFIPVTTVLTLFSLALLHGKVRYGWRNIFLFFIITFIVSNFFEALSIKTGFPFGFYYYDKLLGPRIFEVPLLIMPAYFGMGYASWTLAHLLLNQYHKKLMGNNLFFIPLIATFIMVSWDVCMDPIYSNIDSLWVWVNGGFYFGVPLQNYFGWFLVVYIIFQLFAWYISKYEISNVNQLTILKSKMFWIEMVAVYGIQGLLQILNPITQHSHFEIYAPMAMITVFTMIFITFLSFLVIKR